MQIPDYITIEIWEDFVKHRKEIRHALKPTTIKYLLIKLNKFHADGIDVNACLIQSMESGWQGVFPVRIEKEVIPQDESGAIAWGLAHGVKTKPGESSWDFRKRLEAVL